MGRRREIQRLSSASTHCLTCFYPAPVTFNLGFRTQRLTLHKTTMLRTAGPDPPSWNGTLPVTWSHSWETYEWGKVEDGICEVEQRSRTRQQLPTRHHGTWPPDCRSTQKTYCILKLNKIYIGSRTELSHWHSAACALPLRGLWPYYPLNRRRKSPVNCLFLYFYYRKVVTLIVVD